MPLATCETCRHLELMSETIGESGGFHCALLEDPGKENPAFPISVSDSVFAILRPAEFGCVLHEEKGNA